MVRGFRGHPLWEPGGARGTGYLSPHRCDRIEEVLEQLAFPGAERPPYAIDQPAHQEGGGLIRLIRTFSTKFPQADLRFSVRDNGIGIALDRQEGLVQECKQGQTSGNRL